MSDITCNTVRSLYLAVSVLAVTYISDRFVIKNFCKSLGIRTGSCHESCSTFFDYSEARILVFKIDYRLHEEFDVSSSEQSGEYSRKNIENARDKQYEECQGNDETYDLPLLLAADIGLLLGKAPFILHVFGASVLLVAFVHIRKEGELNRTLKMSDRLRRYLSSYDRLLLALKYLEYTAVAFAVFPLLHSLFSRSMTQ